MTVWHRAEVGVDISYEDRANRLAKDGVRYGRRLPNGPSPGAGPVVKTVVYRIPRIQSVSNRSQTEFIPV